MISLARLHQAGLDAGVPAPHGKGEVKSTTPFCQNDKKQYGNKFHDELKGRGVVSPSVNPSRAQCYERYALEGSAY